VSALYVQLEHSPLVAQQQGLQDWLNDLMEILKGRSLGCARVGQRDVGSLNEGDSLCHLRLFPATINPQHAGHAHLSRHALKVFHALSFIACQSLCHWVIS
jgi:hypothetical protein